MVDVSANKRGVRQNGSISEMSPETLNMIISGQHHKGDVFAGAYRGIQASLRDLGPLCHLC